MANYFFGFGAGPQPRTNGKRNDDQTVPVGTPVGMYSLNASAVNGTLSGSGAANVTVVAPSSLSTNLSASGTYTKGQTVLMTALVASSGSPAPGASVNLILTKSDGSKVSAAITADSTGKAVWGYKIGQKDPKGSYSVVASAIWNAQTATSNLSTFAVQ